MFEKNIFSVSSPVFSELDNSVSTKLSSLVKIYYPSLLIKKIYQIGAFELNSNNWKVVTDKETFIFKRTDVSKYPTLLAQAEWTSQLTFNNFPSLQFLKNVNGDLISKHKEYIYCMTYFENGSYFGAAIEEWKDLMANLKELVDYCIKHNSPTLTIPERLYFTSEEEQLIKHLKKSSRLHEIGDEEINQIIVEYEKSKQDFLSNKDKYISTIFHVDIHPHNLIFKNHRFTLLTDFESFQLTTLEVSFGFGLYKCLRQLLTLTNEPEELKTAISQLKNQFEHFFSKYSFKELIVLAKVDVLKRLLYILNEILHKGESKWSFMFQTQLTALNEITEIAKIIDDNE